MSEPRTPTGARLSDWLVWARGRGMAGIPNPDLILAIEAEAATPAETGLCGAPAIGGPCILPRAHNMGRVDIPEYLPATPAETGLREALEPDYRPEPSMTGRRMAMRCGLCHRTIARCDCERATYRSETRP